MGIKQRGNAANINANEPQDAHASPGKSCLFYLTGEAAGPWKRRRATVGVEGGSPNESTPESDRPEMGVRNQAEWHDFYCAIWSAGGGP